MVSGHPRVQLYLLNICAHANDPTVLVRVRWIIKTLKHPACTVGWLVWLSHWLSLGKATWISHGRNPIGTIQLYPPKNKQNHTQWWKFQIGQWKNLFVSLNVTLGPATLLMTSATEIPDVFNSPAQIYPQCYMLIHHYMNLRCVNVTDHSTIKGIHSAWVWCTRSYIIQELCDALDHTLYRNPKYLDMTCSFTITGIQNVQA